jgi:hypothetical protein
MYDRMMAAKTVDDIPIGSQEWIVYQGKIHSFNVVKHEICNVIVIEYQNGIRSYLKLDEFKARLSEA